jgi:MbtH protein
MGPANFKEARMPGDRQDEDKQIYKVVVNHEEQYSIWPADRPDPGGWRDGGKTGTKAECLAHIKEVWTDMRPLSLRRRVNGN